MARPILFPLALGLAMVALPRTASAQPADLPIPAATTDRYPEGIRLGRADAGPVYVDRRGLTLYGMDMRTLLRWAPDPALFCKDACLDQWEPLLAPAGSQVNIRYPRNAGGQQRTEDGKEFVQPQKAPDWTVIQGPRGPQWVYKGWHMVFTRKGDRRGSSAFDGADGFTWNTLKFVPPVPKIAAPANVATAFVDGAYALTDTHGRVLFTGRCSHDCARWHPLPAALASRGFGDWKVVAGSDRPQWSWRGKPVFVSDEEDSKSVPAGGTVLRP